MVWLIVMHPRDPINFCDLMMGNGVFELGHKGFEWGECKVNGLIEGVVQSSC